MAIRYSYIDIPKLNQKSVFFDANVILYIFWPTGSFKSRDKYSSLFSSLLKNKNRVIVDFTVISEVINRAARIEYDKYIHANGLDRKSFGYKKFRDHTEGQSAINDIYQMIEKKVLNMFDVSGKSFSKTEISGFLKEGKLDFNDKGIEAICKENNYVLLTDDKDFADSEIEILSSNPSLLRDE